MQSQDLTLPILKIPLAESNMYSKKHQSMKCFVMVRMLYDALAVFKMCISGKVTHLLLNKPHGVQYGSHTWLVCTCNKTGVTQKWNFNCILVQVLKI